MLLSETFTTSFLQIVFKSLRVQENVGSGTRARILHGGGGWVGERAGGGYLFADF